MTVTEHKTIKILAGFSGEHCHFFKIGHSQSHFVISLGVSVTKTGKICITELISGTLYRFFSYNDHNQNILSLLLNSN